MFLHFCTLWNTDNLTKFEYIIIIKIFKQSMLLLWFRNRFFFIIHWYKILIMKSFNKFLVCILVIKYVVNEFILKSIRLTASDWVFDSSRIFDPSLDDSSSIFEPEKSNRIQKLKLTDRVGFRSWNWESIRRIVKKSSRKRFEKLILTIEKNYDTSWSFMHVQWK